MGITEDQYSTQASNASTTAFPTNPTAGDKVLLAVWAFRLGGTSVTSVTDNGVTPATWVLDKHFQSANTNADLFLYRADGITLPASGQLTITFTSNATLWEMGAVSLTGAATGGPVDSNSGENAATSVTTSSIAAGTGAGTGSYYIAIHNDNAASAANGEAVNSPFTQRYVRNSSVGTTIGQIADSIGSGLQTCTFTWTTADNPRDLIAVYAPSTGSFSASLTESVGPASDTVARTYVGTRAPVESQATTDSIARQAAMARSASEAQATSDAIATQLAAARSPAETLSASDAVTRSYVGGRAPTEAGTTSDAVARTFAGTRPAAESASTTDSAVRTLARPTAITETLTTADSIARAYAGARASTESHVVSDTVRGVKNASSQTIGATWVLVDGVVQVDASDGDHEWVDGVEKAASGRIWVDGQGK